MQVPRSSVCADRIEEVLGTEPSVVPPAAGVATSALRGELTFDGVDFTYPGAEQPVLSEISLTASRGQTIAVIGSTGAGKSTLLNLVPRLFDATAGTVLVDGVDVRALDTAVLWSAIGLVPQRPYLFSGTIASNLAYGKPDASEAEMWEALEIAQAADFVRRMPGRLEAGIEQGGTNVSGGQRQRLAIARALLTDPRLLILDDSTSAVDAETEAAIQGALDRLMRGANRTAIVIAQRISTVRDADLILVLDEGKVVAQGTHEQLLGTSPLYNDILGSQLQPGTEEAA
jgi:ATP-binding cassette subfamily B protein